MQINQESQPVQSNTSQEDHVDSVDEQPAETDIANAWTTAWDETSRSYYWWNMITCETMWENPYEQDVQIAVNTQQDADAHSKPSQEPHHSPSLTEQSSLDPIMSMDHHIAHSDLEAQDSDYTYQAYFNARTGRFQSASEMDRLNPERMSMEARAKRQMQYYFDVDAYTEQRNQDRTSGVGQKRSLNKRDIERFKHARQEKKKKKARSWLCN